MITFGLVLVIVNMKNGNKYRANLVRAVIIIEFVIWLLAFLYLGKPGAALTDGGFLGFINNVYMINRFFIACMLGLCCLAHDKRISLSAK
jgi:hypothetical protein